MSAIGNALPEILDITAGYRKMWRGKTQNVLFLDIRKEVKPDIVASNEHLPFKDNCFIKVVYDPPHCVRKTTFPKPFPREAEGIKRYMYWKRRIDFIKNIIAVNKEAYRVLKPDGVLFCKHTPLKENRISAHMFISLLDNFKVIRIRKEKSKSHRTKNIVYYITLNKRKDI